MKDVNDILSRKARGVITQAEYKAEFRAMKFSDLPPETW